MRSARDLLLPSLFLADGAMGTYYAQSGPDEGGCCEEANLTHPDVIRKIHESYIKAGAELLRTNTFAAISQTFPNHPDRLQAIIKSGFELASSCAGDKVFVAADFGPAYNLEPDVYFEGALFAIETFLSCGADLFIFETFADPDEFLPLCAKIRERSPESVIIASFALSPDGLTRKGIPLHRLESIMEQSIDVDIWGLNCGVGPTHLAQQLSALSKSGKPLSLMPNSGYPHLENQRLVYGSEPSYFARVVSGFAGPRTRLLGGCCGTTPMHIEALSKKLFHQTPKDEVKKRVVPVEAGTAEAIPSPLEVLLNKNAFPVVCELDPPRTSDIRPFMTAAMELKEAGIDLITVADSPMARVKMDPVLAAARLQRETDLPVLPHLCCRDRNVNALRASLLALHSEGIRQVLVITGDAIPESDRGFIKPVFNLNSVGLLQLINQMNHDPFASDPIFLAAAMDPGVLNPEAEFRRCCQKRDAGAAVFLTQPVFSEEQLLLVRRMRANQMKVLVGLMPLVSYRNAQFLSHEVPGIRIPESILNRFTPDQDPETSQEIGLSIARELFGMIRPEADGLYLIAPFNRSHLIARFLKSIGL